MEEINEETKCGWKGNTEMGLKLISITVNKFMFIHKIYAA
jgi:hypothetical protein